MHGGKRPGAGRRKGATNTKTAIERAAVREKIEAIKSEGDLPLDVLLRIMRTSKDETVIIDCAKAAAPYIHPKLASLEHKGDPDNPLGIMIATGVPNAAADDTDDRPQAH